MSHADKVVDQFRKIIEFVSKHPNRQPASLCARALTITTEILDETEQFRSVLPEMEREPSVDDDPIIREALLTIWNHSHRKLSVSMIAKRIGVTPRTLERHFRETLGKTVLEHIIACRLDRARRMLLETQLPIKNIAHCSGFSSLSNMCKVFQRELSLTPGEYRESITGNADSIKTRAGKTTT